MIQPSASLFRAISAFFFFSFSFGVIISQNVFQHNGVHKAAPGDALYLSTLFPRSCCSMEPQCGSRHIRHLYPADTQRSSLVKRAEYKSETEKLNKNFPSIGMFFLLPVHSLSSASVHFSSFLYQGSVNMQGFHTERKWRTCKHGPAGSFACVRCMHDALNRADGFIFFTKTQKDRPCAVVGPCFETGGQKGGGQTTSHLLVQDEQRIGSPVPKKQFRHLSD